MFRKIIVALTILLAFAWDSFSMVDYVLCVGLGYVCYNRSEAQDSWTKKGITQIYQWGVGMEVQERQRSRGGGKPNWWNKLVNKAEEFVEVKASVPIYLETNCFSQSWFKAATSKEACQIGAVVFGSIGVIGLVYEGIVKPVTWALES